MEGSIHGLAQTRILRINITENLSCPTTFGRNIQYRISTKCMKILEGNMRSEAHTLVPMRRSVFFWYVWCNWKVRTNLQHFHKLKQENLSVSTCVRKYFISNLKKLCNGLQDKWRNKFTVLLYQPQMIGEGDCGAVGGMKIGRGNRNSRRKSAPAPLRPPHIPLDQTRDRTRAAAMGIQGTYSHPTSNKEIPVTVLEAP
jgi:hypothetical protein